MPDYRRAWHPGGTYFFTLNVLQRRDNNLLVRHIEALRTAVRKVRVRYPFTMSIETLDKLAQAFNTTAAELLSEGGLACGKVGKEA